MFFDKSLFSKIIQKINEKPFQNPAKTASKPPKIHPKSQKFDSKCNKTFEEPLKGFLGASWERLGASWIGFFEFAYPRKRPSAGTANPT